ncbi:type I polyketide synthase, partial [Streptomyces alfalfae]
RTAPDAGVPARPAPDAAEVTAWLREALAATTGREAASVDPDLPFAAFGLRSVELVSLVGELERRFGFSLDSGIVWEHPTAAKLAAHLAGTACASPALPAAEPATTLTAPTPATPSPRAAGPGADEPVAIIGIGCRFPGGVNGPDSFWTLLGEGRDAVTEVPADRWSTEEFTHDDPAAPGRTTSRWGGFVDGADRFDSEFFGISQQEAARMDPQQRLLAEVSFEALENAGVPTGSLAGSRTGVFIGISTFDHATGQLSELDAINAYTGTGSALSIAANRLSYLLDLRGPSMAVDSACSSSLVAVLQACASLHRGDCDLAVAGGVNLVLSPAFAINFSKAGVMSAEGRCKPFDASADGYVRSEGVGVVILKPLARALAEGDPVHAVIRGGAVNQDGASNGLMAPNPRAQEAVVRAAHARAGVRAADIAYVEAHGTGTILGDPIEAKALGAVLGEGRAPGRPCLIGSVKSNLGHMEAAAGIGGLIKTALMVRHRTVPPTLHYRAPNPHIPFDGLPLRVAHTPQPWPDTAGPALAGVSSFGFGGTNAHLVVEEPPPPAAPAGPAAEGSTLLTVSARDEGALRDLAARYADKLTAATPMGAFTAGVNVDRLALYEPPFVVAESDGGPPKDLAQQITALLAEGRHSDAVKYFMTRVQGMPGIAVFFMKLMPKMWANLTKLARTLPYDIAVMGDTQQGKPLDAEEWKGAGVRTRVLTGGKSPAAFQRAALAVTEILPQADHRTLAGLNHGAVVMAPKKIAPQIIEFIKG